MEPPLYIWSPREPLFAGRYPETPISRPVLLRQRRGDCILSWSLVLMRRASNKCEITNV